jgi:hypothetical protein
LPPRERRHRIARELEHRSFERLPDGELEALALWATDGAAEGVGDGNE